MPRNIESINTSNNHERIENDNTNRQIGAKVLTSASFENHRKEIVDSSFNKAREKGEKLPGKNNERRNYAYLSRLEDLVDRYGNNLEKKLWKHSVDKMVIKPENITDSYWKTQEQIHRDNGQGRVIDDYEKSILIKDIQKQQRESLESWSNYLGDENSPYPLWFKVYAWDGMTKMGVFDKEKGYFKKRDEHTVAPYPKLNPAVLAKTYSIIADLYGIKSEERYEENEKRNEILETLAASGNFNKLYSKILLSEKAIPKTPERTEDVHGDWIEYLPGDEEKLASAAEGTPWCVADPGTGKNYLEYGNFAKKEDGEYEDNRNNQAKFILFHLYDQEKNMLSESACASIRLNPNGRVAEISGLNEGQALEDSLVPIVEEKVKTLPGGEEFLEAFADKQKLIRLDRKMQNNEDLTREELEFIYSVNRPIKTLDTYNREDPRIEELKEKYNINYALDKGLDANRLASGLGPYEAVNNLDNLLDHGADMNRIVSRLPLHLVTGNLDAFISRGADINQIVPRLDPSFIVDHLDTLIAHGAEIKMNLLVSRLNTHEIFENLDTLIAHGAEIDINQRIHYDPRSAIRYLDTLIAHGAEIDINQLVSRLKPFEIVFMLDTLTAHGAEIDMNQLMSELDPYFIVDNLDTLIDNGAEIDMNQLMSKLDPHFIVGNLGTLLDRGAEIDIDQLASELDPDSDSFDDDIDTLRARYGYQG